MFEDRTSRFICFPEAPFLRSILNWPDGKNIQKRMCTRIESAEKALRANTVFGVYDGITRWIFRILEDQGRTKNGCFEGKDLRDVASGHLLRDKKVIHEVTKTIGINSDNEEICPWDAAKYRHDVDTLILAGRADPVTAGGQAMYFYENGLAPGNRVLIDFPGAGHEMILQVKVPSKKEEPEKNPSEGKVPSKEEEAEKIPSEDVAARVLDKFGSVVTLFLTNDTSHFVGNDRLKGYLDELGARCKADPLPPSLESPEPESPCKPRLYDDRRQ